MRKFFAASRLSWEAYWVCCSRRRRYSSFLAINSSRMTSAGVLTGAPPPPCNMIPTVRLAHLIGPYKAKKPVPNPSIREVEGGRAHGLAPLCRTRLDSGGVGVGLALPSSGPAETRGRQVAPLRRAGYRRVEGQASGGDVLNARWPGGSRSKLLSACGSQPRRG
ncbi:hypothetical protein SBA2_680026 [Acidobacteriia bacterium SbA2]|nr:hypothetical protein SBA2_680026 [Acidobacteriia bacterium SbA2]